MPNPVAEVVERLDVLQEIDAAIEDAQAGQMEHDIIVTLQLAKAEIERLSRERDTVIEECIAVVGKPRTIDAMRGDVAVPDCAQDIIADLRALQGQPRERDTGVPEIKTALGIAHAALTAHNDWHLKQIEPQTIDGMEIVPADAYCDSTLYELTQDALHHVERMEAKLSAAPQPPTVSTQGWQDISTAPRDGRWFLICREDEGPESYEVGCFDPQTWSAYEPAENGLYRKVERVVNEWRGFNNFHRATHWTALLGHPGDPDLSTLTRERDTGVPAANPAACAAAPAVPSYVIVDTPKSEPNLTPSNVFPAEPASRLSAAPQPPQAHPASGMTAENTVQDYTSMDAPALLNALGDDATAWAVAFNQHAVKLGYPRIHEGWLTGWFANAIEHSADVRRWRSQPSTSPVITDFPASQDALPEKEEKA